MLNCSRMMIYVDTERRSSPINNGHLPELTKRDDKKRPKLTNSAQPSCSLLDTPLSLLASRLPCLRSSCSRLRVFFYGFVLFRLLIIIPQCAHLSHHHFATCMLHPMYLPATYLRNALLTPITVMRDNISRKKNIKILPIIVLLRKSLPMADGYSIKENQ